MDSAHMEYARATRCHCFKSSWRVINTPKVEKEEKTEPQGQCEHKVFDQKFFLDWIISFVGIIKEQKNNDGNTLDLFGMLFIGHVSLCRTNEIKEWLHTK